MISNKSRRCPSQGGLRIGEYFRHSDILERGRVGRILSLLVNSNAPPSTIPAIRTMRGEISFDATEIMNAFGEYYKSLYKSRKGDRSGRMGSFF